MRSTDLLVAVCKGNRPNRYLRTRAQHETPVHNTNHSTTGTPSGATILHTYTVTATVAHTDTAPTSTPTLAVGLPVEK